MESVIRLALIIGGIASVVVGVFWRWHFDKDHVMAAATVMLALVAIGQMYILHTTDKTLRHTLYLAHRPWIGVQRIEARYWPTQENGRATFDLSFVLKNVGKSPAVVRVTATAILATPAEEWRQAQRRRCAETREQVRKAGFGEQWNVIPEQEWPYHLSVALETPLAEIQAKHGGEYVAMIVGCVLYRSTFDDEIYETSFVAVTSAEDPGKSAKPRGEADPIRVADMKQPIDRVLLIKDLSMAGESPR